MDYSEKDKQMPRGVYDRSKSRKKPESLELIAPLPRRKYKRRKGWKKKATLVKHDVMIIPVALAKMITSNGKNGQLGRSLLSLLLDARTTNRQMEQE